MIFNMISGGAALNFKIVNGLEQPSNPRENTIWLKTADNISNYSFNSIEPSNQTEGMVWIVLAESGDVSMNILKENEILLYLSSCCQYISSKRNQLDAYIYQSGQWVQFSYIWDGYYFNSGDQYEDITGGWTSDGYSYNSDYALYDGTVGNTLKINLSGAYTASVIGTVNSVDLTDVSTLNIVVDSASTGSILFGVLSSKGLEYSDSIIKTVSLDSSGGTTKTLDVSNLYGQYYLVVYGAGGQTIPNVSASISKIYKN